MKFVMCNILPALTCIWNDVFLVYAKTLLDETFVCAPSFLVCVRLTPPVCAHAQLRGNIGGNHVTGFIAILCPTSQIYSTA